MEMFLCDRCEGYFTVTKSNVIGLDGCVLVQVM